MKRFGLHNPSPGVIFFTSVIAVLLLTRCNNQESDMVAALIQDRTILADERDSLLQALTASNVQLDTLSAAYKSMNENNIVLENKVRSVRAEYNSRGQALKKITEENRSISNVIVSQNAENDSLQNVIQSLRAKIADLGNTVKKTDEKNTILAQTVQKKDQKIKADSLAEVVRKHIPVIKESGYVNIAQVGGGFGLGDVTPDYTRRLVSIENIFGYQASKKVTTGIGTGIHVYNGGTMIPLFVDVRYKFGNTSLAPVIIADGGLMIYTDDPISTGIFIHPAVGVRRKLTPHTSFNLSAGSLVKVSPVRYRATFIVIKGGITFSGNKGPVL